MTDRSRLQTMLPLALMVALLLLAAAVRLHNLGGQSLWYDEGVAYGHSQRSLAEMVPRLQNNVHVPGYFGLLALYEDFVGASEFGLRSLSVWWSVLGVALAYALGKRLYSPTAGVAAAGFVALNTFSVYYAQEARMYAQLTAIGAAAFWVLVALLRGLDREPPGRGIWWAALALALLNTFGVYTHVSYALVMVAQGVMAVLWLLAMGGSRRDVGATLRALGIYTAANLLTIALFAPWLVTAVSQVSAQPNISQPVPLAEMVRLLQGWFGFGLTFEEHAGGMGAAMYFLLLFGLLILPGQRRRAWWYLLLPVVWVLLSVAGYLYLELYARYLRFLLPAQLAFALWLARGVHVLWNLPSRRRDGLLMHLPRFAAVFATLAFMVTQAEGLPHLYQNPAYQRDDYRALVRQIENEAPPGSAVILSSAGLGEIFGYYYDGRHPVYGLPVAGASPQQTRANTRAVIDDHGYLYVVLYGSREQDPEGVIEHTLNREAYPLREEWIGDVRLLRYVSGVSLLDAVESGARFGDPIQLVRYALNRETAASGDALALRLAWQTDELLAARYKVFVQLLSPEGALVAQRDSEPVGGLQPTTAWVPGEIVNDQHALIVPDLPAGEYTLIAGLYDASNPAQRLPVSGAPGGGDYIRLGTIRVTAGGG